MPSVILGWLQEELVGGGDGMEVMSDKNDILGAALNMADSNKEKFHLVTSRAGGGKGVSVTPLFWLPGDTRTVTNLGKWILLWNMPVIYSVMRQCGKY